MALYLFWGGYIFGVFNGYANTYFVTNSFNDLLINLIVGLCGSIIIIKISQFINKSKVLEWFGVNSGTILCVHLFELETMSFFYKRILNYISYPDYLYYWLVLVLRLAFIIVITLIIINCLKHLNILKNHQKISIRINHKRDLSIDILRGILITSMIVGHFEIDNTLREIIYSCHMISFVFISGYFYKKDDFKNQFFKLVKSLLLPYLLFAILYFILNFDYVKSMGFIYYAEYIICGISYTDKLFINIKSVGPVYFILLLFLVRIIYILLDKYIKEDYIKTLICVVLSFIGLLLGEKGYWLPWSLDIALYCIVYFEIGVLFKRYNLLKKISSYYINYFILSIIWAYMIYEGSMEIAKRNYQPFFIVIIGSVSGMLLLYMLSQYISSINILPINTILGLIGKNTLYILIVHRLFNNIISQCLGLYFDNRYIYYFILVIVIQLLIGTLLGEIINIVKKAINKNYLV